MLPDSVYYSTDCQLGPRCTDFRRQLQDRYEFSNYGELVQRHLTETTGSCSSPLKFKGGCYNALGLSEDSGMGWLPIRCAHLSQVQFNDSEEIVIVEARTQQDPSWAPYSSQADSSSRHDR